MNFILKFRIALTMLLYPPLLRLKKSIIINRNVKIRDFPHIFISKSSKIHIGKNVTLNSSNYNYHINMHSPVKLIADGKNSEIFIDDYTRIHGSCIHAQSKITIGKNCLVAANCQIFDSNGHLSLMNNAENRLNSRDIPKPISIGDNVWIGSDTYILPGITIGKGSVIAAGSIVVKNIPENVLVGGNPAIILKRL